MNEIFSIVSLTDPKFNISGYFKYLSTISWWPPLPVRGTMYEKVYFRFIENQEYGVTIYDLSFLSAICISVLSSFHYLFISKLVMNFNCHIEWVLFLFNVYLEK
jgi:hypothetical protein